MTQSPSSITAALARMLAQADDETARALNEMLATPVSTSTGAPDRSGLWTPQPGPQFDAYESEADILFYGGAAGGGKSDLLLGLALTQHQRSIIFRKETTQNQDFVDRLTTDILKTDKGWSGQRMSWDISPLTNFPGHRLDFGGLSDPGSEQRYKGRPHDFIGFDEAVDFSEFQIRFLSTWNRTTLDGQRCRVVLASNPPAPTAAKHAAAGLWLINFFAPWLDPEYRDPLGLGRPEYGALRWHVRLPNTSRDQEWPDGMPFRHFDETKGAYVPITPQSRTFIPAKVHDNAYLANSNYLSVLQSLHEPLRSIMLEGDFSQALSDKPMALFPAQWVRDAVRRWKDIQGPQVDKIKTTGMTALGFDVARGGVDSTVGSPLYGTYYDTLETVPGSTTPDGPTAAGFAVSWARDEAVIVVDANGPGGAVYDHLNKTVNATCRAYVGSSKARFRDRTGKFTFPNLRCQSYWKLREALDPSTPDVVYLPDDEDLIAELFAHDYEVRSGRIHVTTKERVQKALGRSPDRSDSVVMAWTVPRSDVMLAPFSRGNERTGYTRRTPSRRLSSKGPIDYGEDHVI